MQLSIKKLITNSVQGIRMICKDLQTKSITKFKKITIEVVTLSTRPIS